ncbi:MAG: hypothetical protein ACP6IQ_06800 [Candidatus Njordarchaeia archaeon]|nr:hypothetical protein [Candidatus Korarchaeota archaeon]
MNYLTLALPFSVSDAEAKKLLSTAWLFKIASHRMLRLAKNCDVLPASDIGWKSMFRKSIYSVITNRRYADGVITLVRGIYESCRQLKVNFEDVELGNWIMFQQFEMEYPVRTITLKQDYSFRTTTLDYNGLSERISIKPAIPRNYSLLLSKIPEEKQKHTARIVIKDYGVRKNKVWVHGEIQLTIPLSFYYRYMRRFEKNKGKLFGGVDMNCDRINLAIVDRFGRLRDVKTFWFRETTARGFPKRKARVIIGMKIHEMLKYAYFHGVSKTFLENSEILGKLKLLWIRNGKRLSPNYNWKVAVFRSSIIEMISMKAPLYSIKAQYVNPKGTTSSNEHKEIAKKLGLDRHTASAYLIALRGLRQNDTV